MRIISLASRTAALCKAVGPQKRCVPNGGRILDKKNYKKLAESASKGSPIMKNCLCAFLFGGAICAAAQGLGNVYRMFFEKKDAASLTSVTLIFIAVLLTGLGVFDKIASHAGAGTLVPITGFANSVVSPAMDFKNEGFIYGLAAKMFVVAGPIIVFGIIGGVSVGVVYFILYSAGLLL